MEDLNDREELRRIAPVLSSLPKGDPFVTPDAFFDRFPHQVQAMVTKAETRPPFLSLRRIAIALPVIACIGLGAWWMLHDPAPAPAPIATVPVEVTPLSDEELTAMDPHELMASVDEEELAPWDSVDVDLSDAELLAYAEHEDIDITELITTP